MSRIALIDYGMGNLHSVKKALEQVDTKVVITGSPQEVLKADKVVLPGVGAFPDFIKNLKKNRLIDSLIKTIEKNKPFLGICLGLHALFEESEEFGRHKGLGLFKGRVVHFQLPSDLSVPHMGWNQIHIKKKSPCLKGIKDKSYFYFVHSYHVIPEDNDLIATTTDYGNPFVSSIAKDNLFACQFHPEKSQDLGLKVLENFAKL
ncbi:MAG: imidazole glycerol phosphate synthase, glutamine amidotransferase subunit [Deltaproteobacteria bacterium RIFCSPLOWO2_12_FULL_50_11]|nr:MAG: imidazole glycerol phosphate synthase, glutamine amidotransferase subunit [Deltaproteobacteria bacterium RIFCSPLOWO2_12_FULL_50_11]